jgi:hypothetical protein
MNPIVFGPGFLFVGMAALLKIVALLQPSMVARRRNLHNLSFADFCRPLFFIHLHACPILDLSG